MAQVVTGSLTVTASASERVTNGLATGTLAPALASSLTFGNGAGSGNINYVITKSATATATPTTYTLSAMTDDLGRSVPFTKIRVLMLVHLGTTDAQPLTVGAAASAPWVAPFADISDKVKVNSGGVLVLAGPLATGYAVAVGTSDQFKIDPGANTIPFRLIIMGE